MNECVYACVNFFHHLAPIYTHQQRWVAQSSCVPAALRFDIRTCQRRVFAPILFATSSHRCPGDVSPGNADPRCTCTHPRWVCVCHDAVSTKPMRVGGWKIVKGLMPQSHAYFQIYIDICVCYINMCVKNVCVCALLSACRLHLPLDCIL